MNAHGDALLRPAVDTDSARPDLPAGCTFDAADWYRLARCWFAVAEASAVVDSVHACTLLDQPLVLYRVAGNVVAARDACPHRGVPLSMGTVESCGLRCAYHGLLFGADGRCREIPSCPDRPIPPRLHLHTLPVVERHGLLWTCLWPQAGVSPSIPAMPEWEDPAYQTTVCPRYPMACFAGRQVEGFIDVAHFPWVHRTTFAMAEERCVPAYEVIPHPQGFTADYFSAMPNYPLESGMRAPEGFVWRRHFDVQLPFAARLTLHFPHDARVVITNLATPVSALRTDLFVPVARNFDTDRPAEEMQDFNRRVFDEDRPLMEAQRPRNLPLQPGAEPNIPADRSSLAYRRALSRQGYGRFFAG